VFGTASAFDDREDDTPYPLYEDNGDALDLAHRLTLHSAADRLTAAQALDHPFLRA
jgi:hypothetical protein